MSGQGTTAYNVLFLSSGNAGCSLIAEALLNGEAEGRFRAYSAGMDPSAQIHPLAIATLIAKGYSIDGLEAKPVSAFLGPEAPVMHFIFALSDDAAGEMPPDWPGDPVTAQWAIEDPTRIRGTPVERERAFETAFRYLRNRVRAFAALPLATLDRLTVRRHLAAIAAGVGDGGREADAG